MSIEPLLNLIKQKFSPSECQLIVQGLSQDPLTWQFIQGDENSLQYFQSTQSDLHAFTPGPISLWMIEQKTGISIEDVANVENKLPPAIRQMAGQAFETVLNTGLPPSDLFTAGLLGLALRERRTIKGSWEGIADEMFLKGKFQAAEKNYLIWRTPVACLFSISGDFEKFMAEFLPSRSNWVENASIPIFLHAHLCNPNEMTEDQIFDLAKHLPIDHQLASLRWLEKFNYKKLSQSLARNLLQTKTNVDFFANTFSELELYDLSDQERDPLEKQVNYTLPENLNRLAAFYYFSGDAQKAADTYLRSSNVLDFLRSQALYQSVIGAEKQADHSKLVQILKSVPHATNARFLYIKELIESRTFAEAEKTLGEMIDSPQKQYLQFLLELNKNESKPPALIIDTMIAKNQQSDHFTLQSYFVHPVQIDNRTSLLEHAKKLNLNQTEWLDDVLTKSSNDPEIIAISRDLYEHAQQLDKATELTAYLQAVQPEKKEHKRALARLYCAAERWKDAFGTLQDLIKSESRPDIGDLEMFAQSALETDHIDMGTAICHNIIKQDPYNSKALILLGESYLVKGDMAKAIQHMEQVVELIPEEAEPWLTLARIWQENGQTDRAFEVLTKGTLAVPNHPKLLRSLGKAHLMKHAPADALTFLTKAHEIEPNNIEGLLDLVQTKYQLGQNDQALELLEPFESTFDQNPQIAKLLGLVLLSMNDQVSAEPKLLVAAEHLPQDTDTVLTTANLVLTQQELSLEQTDKAKLEKMAAILESALEKNQDSYRIRLALADIKRLLGEHEKALEAYRNLAEVSTGESAAEQWHLSYGLGKSATALGNFDLALAALKDANNKMPGNLMVLHALSEAYQANDFSDKAHSSAQSTLKLAPQNINNILWYADFMTKSNEVEEAKRALSEALQMNPNNPDLKLRHAKLLLSTGSIGEAEQHIKDLINHQYANSSTLQRAGYLCIELNQTDLALKAFEKAYGLSDKLSPTLLLDFAYSFTLNNQPTKALEILNLNDSEFQSYPQLALMKSDLLTNLGQYDQAFEILNGLIKHESDESIISDGELDNIAKSPLLYATDFSQKGFLHRYGQLALSLGYFTKGQNALSKALEIEPENIELKNDLIQSHLAALDFDKAMEVAHQHSKNLKTNETFDDRELSNLMEINLFQKGRISDEVLINNLPQIKNKSSRLIAIQSLLAAKENDNDQAEQFYQDAVNQYQQHYGHPSPSLKTLFEQAMTLSSLAAAAVGIKDYQSAKDHHQKALSLFENQPYLIWRAVLDQLQTAKDQQIANALSITKHAPGASVLHQENLEIIQQMIEKIKNYLPEEQVICLKAKAVAAITGKWPLRLNAEACLNDPKEAAAVIIATDEDQIVQDLLSAYPDDPDVLQAYGIYAIKTQRNDAIPLVEKAIKKDILNPVNYALLSLLQKNEPSLAIRSLETALSFWSDEPEWHAMVAEIYKSLGNIEMAGKHIKQALILCPDNSCYWEKSGEIKLELNDLDQAKEDLEKSVSLESHNPALWMKMANVNRRLGNAPQAINDIHKASELDPDNTNIMGQEIKILLDQNQFADAEKRSKELLGHNPNNETFRIFLAQSQANQGHFDEALQTLNPESVIGQKSAGLRLETLKIKKEQEGIEATLPQLISLAEELPNESSVLITLTDWLIQTNRLKKAEETAQTILRIIPDQPEVQLMLGRLQRKNGQLDQAIQHLSDAINADPFLVDAYIELGKTYQDRKNLEEAIKVYQKASKTNPADARPYYHAGMAMKECKNYSDAEIMLKQAKKFAPNDANIIRQLGVITALNLIHNLRETR